MYASQGFFNLLFNYRAATRAICSQRLLHVEDVETQREACRCARAFIRSDWSAAAALARFSANDLFAKPLDPEARMGLLWEAGKARVASVDDISVTLNDGRRLLRPGYTPPIQFTGPNAWEQMAEKVARRKARRAEPKAGAVA